MCKNLKKITINCMIKEQLCSITLLQELLKYLNETFDAKQIVCVQGVVFGRKYVCKVDHLNERVFFVIITTDQIIQHKRVVLTY